MKQKGQETAWTDVTLSQNGFNSQAEKKSPATSEQKRLLAFGCVQLIKNREPCKSLQINCSEDTAAELLRGYWGIENSKKATETAVNLSKGQVHTEYTDEFFTKLVKSGKPEVSEEDVRGFVKELSLFRTVSRELRDAVSRLGIQTVYKSSIPTESLIDSFAEIATNGSISINSVLPAELSENDKKEIVSVAGKFKPQYIQDIYKSIAESINKTLDIYREAYAFLLEQGYTAEELAGIKTIAAWDYGRTGIIARYSVKMGFMEEAQAWQILQTAADNAQKCYGNWREYLAAYILGRAIAFKQSSTDYADVAGYLLNDESSPYKECAFKAAGSKPSVPKSISDSKEQVESDPLVPVLFGELSDEQLFGLFTGLGDAKNEDEVKQILLDKTESSESRQKYIAWKRLRELSVSPDESIAKEVLGYVIEVGMDAGVDYLAVYADNSARYFNYSGKKAIYENANIDDLNDEIQHLIGVCGEMVKKLGVYNGKRRPPPAKNMVRVNFLTPSGLFFGEGPFSALANDDFSRDLIALSRSVMSKIVDVALKKQD